MVFRDAPNGPEAVEFLKFLYRDDNYIRYLHTVPIHLLPITKSTYRNPRYADNPTIRKWRPWVNMQERYFKNDWIKPILVTEWGDMQRPYLLEVMGSGILVDMVFDAVKGSPRGGRGQSPAAGRGAPGPGRLPEEVSTAAAAAGAAAAPVFSRPAPARGSAGPAPCWRAPVGSASGSRRGCA